MKRIAGVSILMAIWIIAISSISQTGAAEKPSLPLLKGSYKSLTPYGLGQHYVTYYDDDAESQSSQNPLTSHLEFSDIDCTLDIREVHNQGNTYFVQGNLVDNKDKFVVGSLRLTIDISNDTSFEISNASIHSKYVSPDKFIPKNRNNVSYQLKKE